MTNLLAGMAGRNTRLYVNCLAGLTDGEARARPGGATNNIAFIALHLVDVRFYLAAFLGLRESNPYEALLAEVRGIDDLAELPPVADLRSAWLAISPAVERRIAGLTVDELMEPTANRFPLAEATRGSGVAFLLQHEMYHIGQLALLRRYAGQDAMKWT